MRKLLLAVLIVVAIMAIWWRFRLDIIIILLHVNIPVCLKSVLWGWI